MVQPVAREFIRGLRGSLKGGLSALAALLSFRGVLVVFVYFTTG